MTKPHDGTPADMEREIRELRSALEKLSEAHGIAVTFDLLDAEDEIARLTRALAAGPAALHAKVRALRPCGRVEYIAAVEHSIGIVEAAQRAVMEEK